MHQGLAPFDRWRRILPWYVGRIAKWRGLASIDGCRFDVSTPHVSRFMAGILMLGRYEESERRILRRFLDPDLPVVELGASSGVIACLTNRRLRSPREHVVVEANPDLIPLLERNRELNRCQFTVVHGAVAYGTDHVSFAFDSSLVAGRISGATDPERTVTVPTVQLRSLIRERGWQACTLVCDIEGAEAELIESDLDVIGTNVKWILIETHRNAQGRDTFDQIWPRLRNIGFEHRHNDGQVHVFRSTR